MHKQMQSCPTAVGAGMSRKGAYQVLGTLDNEGRQELGRLSRYLLQPKPVASLLLCEAHDFPSENPGIWQQNGSFQHPVQGQRFHHLQVPGRYK